jgi:hypothetical protein
MPTEPSAKRCEWKDDVDGNWDTSCGQMFTFIDGGPLDNGLRFCGYCGKPIHEVRGE